MRDCSDGMRATARRQLREAGYAHGGAVEGEKHLIRKAVHQHETAEHGGRHVPLKIRRGGPVHGKHAESRPDRRARGGATKPHVGAVNIKVGQADQGEKQMAARQGMQAGMQMGARAAMQRMAGPAAGGGPPIGPRPMPPAGIAAAAPGGIKDGGKIRVREHERRRAGGAVHAG